MFRGVHNLTIDAKGRLKIPTRHQVQINKICEGKMVLSIHPDDPCLTDIVTITGRYIYSVNSYCDNNGVVYMQCKQLL
jgi:hypothetical protein